MRTIYLLRFLLVFIFVSVFMGSYPRPVEAASHQQEGKQGGIDVDIQSQLLEKVDAEGMISILVGLKVDASPEMTNEPAQRIDAIRAAQKPFQEYLSAYSINSYQAYDMIPYVAMRVDRKSLEAVLAYPDVFAVEEDIPVLPALDASVPLIGAPAVWASGYNGAGWAVAILDTGVQWNHGFFSGGSNSRVIYEACFSNGGGGGQSLCQNATHQASPLVPRCQYGSTNLCAHGTHVAGIVAGSGTSYSGVAPAANILAIQVFTRFTRETDCGTGNAPCVMSYTSDQILGLQRIYQLSATYQIAAVNLSLGGGQYDNQAICNSYNSAMRTAVQSLRAVGIATVSTAGNDADVDGLNAPGCISEVIGVGATLNDDTIASYSNSNDMLDLLAPGDGINSSVPNNAYATYGGTSMSAAHVSGAWALLKSVNPTATVADILETLQMTGVPITDTRNSLAFARIQLDAAAAALLPNVWQGNVSDSWNDAANWSAAFVPHRKSNVIIPTNPVGGRFPRVDAPGATLQHLTIESGATISMSANTLNVYGNWWVQGTGSFDATGGTVIMAGMTTHTIMQAANALDHFYHLQIGSGTDQSNVVLNSDLNVDGNLTIQPGSAFSPNSYTISVAGNWADVPGVFSPGMNSVVFDGSYQVISSTSQVLLLDEDFSDFDNTTANTVYPAYPDGWVATQVVNSTTSLPWLSGRMDPAANSLTAPLPDQGGQIRHIWHSSYLADFDTWLFTPGLDLSSNAIYRLEFDYGARSAAYPERLVVRYGSGQTASSMTADLYQNLNIINTTWNTGVVTFTIPSDGRYFIGFRTYGTQLSTWDLSLDNIKITQSCDPSFYNLSVTGADSEAVLSSNVFVANNLIVNPGAHLNLDAYHLSVNGTLTNHGTLSQRKDVPTGATTEFLHIQSADGTADRYHGIDITPDMTSMGMTTVSIRGNQASGCTSRPGDAMLHRCFEITPTSAQAAMLRLWYTEAERNGQAANNLALWHYGAGSWSFGGTAYTRSENGNTCTSDGGLACWVQATHVIAYSPFALGSGAAPTAVHLLSLSAKSSPGERWLVVSLIGIALALSIWFVWRRRCAFQQSLK